MEEYQYEGTIQQADGDTEFSLPCLFMHFNEEVNYSPFISTSQLDTGKQRIIPFS